MPKSPDNRARRREPIVELEAAEPLKEKPPIPDGEWHPLAVAWWNDFWASPQAKLVTSLGKYQVIDLMIDRHLFYTNPTERMGQRIAVLEEALLISTASMRRNNIKVPVAEPEKTDKPKRAATASRDPRKRLRVVS
jgi:hypothetical protein